jgi:hypothetical protein
MKLWGYPYFNFFVSVVKENLFEEVSNIGESLVIVTATKL